MSPPFSDLRLHRWTWRLLELASSSPRRSMGALARLHAVLLGRGFVTHSR